MVIYYSYKIFIKEGFGEVIDYLTFVLLCIPGLLIDIILSPIEIIALILWKLGGNK